MKNTIYLIIAVLAVLFATHETYAQSFYGPQGQYMGQAIQSGGNTSYYSAQGQYQGQSVQNGNNTSFYSPQGQYQGSVTSNQPVQPQSYYVPPMPQLPQQPYYRGW